MLETAALVLHGQFVGLLVYPFRGENYQLEVPSHGSIRPQRLQDLSIVENAFEAHC